GELQQFLDFAAAHVAELARRRNRKKLQYGQGSRFIFVAGNNVGAVFEADNRAAAIRLGLEANFSPVRGPGGQREERRDENDTLHFEWWRNWVIALAAEVRNELQGLI